MSPYQDWLAKHREIQEQRRLENEGIEAGLAQKKLDLESKSALATAPRSYGRQDALATGIASILPMVLGAALAGKRGAGFGAKTGQKAGTTYAALREERMKDSQEKAADSYKLGLDSYEDDLDRSRDITEDMNESDIDLMKTQYLQSEKNARSAGSTGGLSGIAKALSGLPGAIQSIGADKTASMSSDDVISLALDRIGVPPEARQSPEVIGAVAKLQELGQKGAKGELDITAKELGIEEDKLNLVIQRASQEMKLAGIPLEKRNQELTVEQNELRVKLFQKQLAKEGIEADPRKAALMLQKLQNDVDAQPLETANKQADLAGKLNDLNNAPLEREKLELTNVLSKYGISRTQQQIQLGDVELKKSLLDYDTALVRAQNGDRKAQLEVDLLQKQLDRYGIDAQKAPLIAEELKQRTANAELTGQSKKLDITKKEKKLGALDQKLRLGNVEFVPTSNDPERNATAQKLYREYSNLVSSFNEYSSAVRNNTGIDRMFKGDVAKRLELSRQDILNRIEAIRRTSGGVGTGSGGNGENFFERRADTTPRPEGIWDNFKALLVPGNPSLPSSVGILKEQLETQAINDLRAYGYEATRVDDRSELERLRAKAAVRYGR